MFNILTIYKQPDTVFSTTELALIFAEEQPVKLKKKLNYATKTGKLLSLRRGIYAKEGYSSRELATKIYTPSYISLETVLVDHGVTFQHNTTITAISYVSRQIICDDLTIQYRKTRDYILTNKAGIVNTETYFEATLERAFLDALFLYRDYHFDNLGPIDFTKAAELLPIYENKTLNRRFKDIMIKHDR